MGINQILNECKEEIQADKEAEHNVERYKKIRAKVNTLEEQLKSRSTQHHVAKQNLKQKLDSLQDARNKKMNCLKAIEKLNKEMKLISQFESKEQRALDELKDNIGESQKMVEMCKQALQPVEKEKLKLKGLIEALQGTVPMSTQEFSNAII